MRLTSQMYRLGHSAQSLRREVAQQKLVHIRRGAYRAGDQDLSPEQAHLELVAATIAQARGEVVISHVSAAVVHGLPVNRAWLHRAHVTAEGKQTHSSQRGPVVRHRAKQFEWLEVDGRRVTTVAQTVVDLCRRATWRDGVALADAALRVGVTKPELQNLVLAQPGRHHNRKVLAVIDFAHEGSETAGESHTRAVMFEAGVEMPELQAVFVDPEGEMRTDFWWRERHVFGEFDGTVKYGRALRNGQPLEAVLRKERHREVRLQRLGEEPARFIWAELTPARVRRIVLDAFALAARRAA